MCAARFLVSSWACWSVASKWSAPHPPSGMDNRDRQGEDIPQIPRLRAVERGQAGLLAEVLLEENLARSRLEFVARRDDVRAGPRRVQQVGVGGSHGGGSVNLSIEVPAVESAEDRQTLTARHVGRSRDRGYGNHRRTGQHRAYEVIHRLSFMPSPFGRARSHGARANASTLTPFARLGMRSHAIAVPGSPLGWRRGSQAVSGRWIRRPFAGHEERRAGAVPPGAAS